MVSDESDAELGAVVRLYRAYLLRNPDHAGFTYWVNRRVAGRSLLNISSTFAGSSEFRNRYGSLTNSAFVDLVYRNVMGRPADAAGRSYWIRKLATEPTRPDDGELLPVQRVQVPRHPRVVATYEALLQQAVPNDVYTFYVAGLRSSGTSLTAITTSLYDSSAYRARFR